MPLLFGTQKHKIQLRRPRLDRSFSPCEYASKCWRLFDISYALGIPIDGPANVFCDNKSVVTNATVLTSTLKKKHNAIAYHRVREAVAAQTLQIAKVHTSENLADLLTKPLSGLHLKNLIQKILW